MPDTILGTGDKAMPVCHRVSILVGETVGLLKGVNCRLPLVAQQLRIHLPGLPWWRSG